MFQTEEEKTEKKRPKWSRDKKSTHKTVQGNNHKEAQGTWENGWTHDKFTKELENIKKNQTELKNNIIEIKNILEGINNRLHDTEEQITDLEVREVEITQTKQKK